MDKEQILNCVGKFTWMFGCSFFVETEFGNFEWKDPSYMGTNSFTKISKGYEEYCKLSGVSYGRDKGKHVIKNYCGDKINIVM